MGLVFQRTMTKFLEHAARGRKTITQHSGQWSSGRTTPYVHRHGEDSVRCRSNSTATASRTTTSAQEREHHAVIRHPDGRCEESTEASGAWLASMERGAYTTARTVGGDCVFELSFHLQRLVDSLELMGFDEHGTALDLKHRVLSSMRGAVQEFTKTHRGELKITVLVVMDGERPRVWTHVTALGPQARHPIKVMIHGHPRDNAEAKDSEWVRERQSLEKTMPSDVNEVVLIGENGNLFEGLSSNFFALHGGVLYTAGDGVLLGSVREAVLRSAERLHIPVVLQPPNIKDMDAWDAAFVSSTSRMLLHVDSLVLFDGAERVFDKAPLAQRLEEETEKEIKSCCEPLL